MQQTITINIVDPANLDTDTLPQTGSTITNWLIQHPLLFAIIGIVIVFATIALFSRALLRKRSVVAGLRGGGISSHKKFFIAPFLLLVPLTLFTAQFVITQPNQTAYAAVTASASNQTVNISQGDTSATFSVKVLVDNTTYADGYNIDAKIDLGASTIPAGVALDYGSDTLNDTTEVEVRKYRLATDPTDDGQIEYTIAIPANAPIGDGYVIITLDYTVDNFMEYLANKQAIMNNTSAGSLVNMQQLTSAICANTAYDATNDGNNANNTITLNDTRIDKDNLARGDSTGQAYRVRKLADDKCWMIDNLMLNLEGITLTNADTALTTVSSIGPIDTKTGTGRVFTGDFQTSGYMSLDGANSYTAGNLDIWGQVNPSASGFWCNNPGNWPTGSTTGCGYLYNFYAATAGTTSDSAGSGTIAPDSICPSNWRLPTGQASDGVSSDFSALAKALGGTGADEYGLNDANPPMSNWQAAGAFAGLFSGHYGNSLNFQDISANWWSSSVFSTTSSYYVDMSSGNITPGVYGYSKISGISVRCVL